MRLVKIGFNGGTYQWTVLHFIAGVISSTERTSSRIEHVFQVSGSISYGVVTYV